MLNLYKCKKTFSMIGKTSVMLVCARIYSYERSSLNPWGIKSNIDNIGWLVERNKATKQRYEVRNSWNCHCPSKWAAV